MGKDSQKCVWIGIGVDINSNNPLYPELLKMRGCFNDQNKEFHLNLYDLSILESNLESAVNKLKHLIKDQKSFKVKIKRVDCFPFGIFFLELENIKELHNLHERIIELINPLKGDCIEKDYLERKDAYNKQQKEMFSKYGNPYALKQFKPHITISHIKNNNSNFELIKKDLEKLRTEKEFEINNVNIVKEDNNLHLELTRLGLIK